MISMQSREPAQRFKERLLRLGLFATYQIDEIHDPSKESLEKRIKKLEETIESAGREHHVNTFLMIYYFGPA